MRNSSCQMVSKTPNLVNQVQRIMLLQQTSNLHLAHMPNPCWQQLLLYSHLQMSTCVNSRMIPHKFPSNKVLVNRLNSRRHLVANVQRPWLRHCRYNLTIFIWPQRTRMKLKASLLERKIPRRNTRVRLQSRRRACPSTMEKWASIIKEKMTKNAQTKVFNLALWEAWAKRERTESLKGGISKGPGNRDMAIWTTASPWVANPLSRCAREVMSEL